MSERVLSLNEKCLLITTVVVISISIVLSICIGYILPPNVITSETITNDTYLISYCKCPIPILPELHISLRCAPRMKLLNSNRSLGKTALSASNIAHPYLASVSISIYADNENERKFVCSGVILTSIWVLVGQDCVKNDEWLLLQVRVGSAYWADKGTIHKVTNSYKLLYYGPIALKVNPPIAFNSVTKPVSLNANKWIAAFSADWFKPNERKFKKYFVEQWSKKPCVGYEQFSGEITGSVSCRLSHKGSGLVTNDGTLVAFRLGTCELKVGVVSIFIDLQTGIYSNWVNFLITAQNKKSSFVKIFTDETKKETTKVYSVYRDCPLHFNSLMLYSKNTSIPEKVHEDIWVDMINDYEDGVE